MKHKMEDLPKLDDVKVIPITEPIDRRWPLTMTTQRSLKQKREEINRLIKEFQSELASIILKKIGEDLQLDSRVNFGYDGFGIDAFVTIFLPNWEMSREDLDDYMTSLKESDEFKDIGSIFYRYEVIQNKGNENDQWFQEVVC